MYVLFSVTKIHYIYAHTINKTYITKQLNKKTYIIIFFNEFNVL